MTPGKCVQHCDYVICQPKYQPIIHNYLCDFHFERQAEPSTYTMACEVFLDQGSNPCPLHWQADSQSLDHQGSHGKVVNICTWETNATELDLLLALNARMKSQFILNSPS